jgi:hypothetical protein
MRAFASALDAIPLALAENSGLSPIETLADVKSRQIKEGDSKLGIDCSGKGENGVWRNGDALFDRHADKISRYEETICLRPSDLEETTVLAGDTGSCWTEVL